MNKEEILLKSRKENAYLNEREQQEYAKSFAFGGLHRGRVVSLWKMN